MSGVPQTLCFRNDLAILPSPAVSSAKSKCGFIGLLSWEVEARLLETNQMTYFEVREPQRLIFCLPLSQTSAKNLDILLQNLGHFINKEKGGIV